MATLKIYETVTIQPSHDIRHMIGELRGQARYIQYVVAPTKVAAVQHLSDANMGAYVQTRDVRLAMGLPVEPIKAAGLLDEDGDVVVTDERHHTKVVFAPGRPGVDPRVVGQFELRPAPEPELEGETDKYLVMADTGDDDVVYVEPDPSGLRAHMIRKKVEQKAEAAVKAAAVEAAQRVEAYLDSRTGMRGINPWLIHSVGGVGNDELYELLTSDLRALLADRGDTK